jgi:hypothetical protein
MSASGWCASNSKSGAFSGFPNQRRSDSPLGWLLPSLPAGLRAVCATFPDSPKGRSGNIAMADFGLAAFALFFMQSASFLSFQRTLEKGQGRSNCQNPFGIAKIPADNYISDMLDLVDPALLRPLLAEPPRRDGVFDDAILGEALDAPGPSGCRSTLQAAQPRAIGQSGVTRLNPTASGLFRSRPMRSGSLEYPTDRPLHPFTLSPPYSSFPDSGSGPCPLVLFRRGFEACEDART